MTDRIESPRITRLSWVRIEIEGNRSFKDVKVYNKLAVEEYVGGLFRSTC